MPFHAHFYEQRHDQGRGRQAAERQEQRAQKFRRVAEEATHFSDAADKIVWTKFGEKLKDKGGSFVPARVGK